MFWPIIAGVVAYGIYRAKRIVPTETNEQLQSDIETIHRCLVTASVDSSLISQATSNSGDTREQTIEQLRNMHRIPAAPMVVPLWTDPQPVPVLLASLAQLGCILARYRDNLPTDLNQAAQDACNNGVLLGQAGRLTLLIKRWLDDVEASYKGSPTEAYLSIGKVYPYSTFGAVRIANYVPWERA